jgi:predicted nucleic acid-binding protein
VICFDTSPLIWGVQGKARSNQEHMVARTRRYIDYLSEKQQTIMVPAPVLHEYLIRFEGAQRQEQLLLICEQFFVPAFDAPSAALAAEIESNRELMQSLASDDVSRNHLRVDTQIVATAIVHNAAKIVSADPHLGAMARGRIVVGEVPIIDEQGELF